MFKTSDEKQSLMIPAAMPWLRLFAVFMVYTGHSKLGLASGHGSVFFLVLTGFTFTRFFIMEWTKSRSLQIKMFLKKRLTKIIPAFYTAIFINVFIKWIFNSSINYSQVISNLFFAGNYYNAFNGHPNTGFSHFWTVSMMIQFYLFWPLLFVFLARRTKTVFNMSLSLSLIIAAVIFYRTFLVFTHPEANAYIYNSLETRLDSFLIGAIFAININHRIFQKVRETVRKHKWTFIPVIVAIASMSELSLPVRNTFGFALHSTLIGLLIVQLGAFGQSYIATSKFHFQTEFLGEVTYWFYLLHPWGFYIGKLLHTNAYIEMFFGGFFVLGSLTILCVIKKRGFNSLLRLPKLIRKPFGFIRQNILY
ncbi:MAG: acyltransferase [Rhizobacter sp.]|nr:acyltransferase [Bacteriovorax sp.]